MSPNPSQYDYSYPSDLVATEPAQPRTSARLLVYDRATQQIVEDTFEHVDRYLAPKSVIVLNDTKVLPSRLWCTKSTGGKAQVLIVGSRDGHVQAMVDRKLEVGSRVFITSRSWFVVAGVTDGVWRLEPSFPLARLAAVLTRHGHMPIPPYLRHTRMNERGLRAQYQTVWARREGSSAAPTASLHFSRALIARLKRQGHTVVYVTLHVGMGTFAPLTPQQLATGKLHQEEVVVTPSVARVIDTARAKGRAIVAVGTTVARALESSSVSGHIVPMRGVTDIFIQPGYTWRVVDQLITNFHVPRSSLMMLVASLVGRTRLLALYQYVVSRGFRLFSFGDGMMVK